MANGTISLAIHKRVKAMMDIITSESDSGSNAGNRLSLTLTNPKRMSMDQYYIVQKAHLPGYSNLIQSDQPRLEFSVQPREDEGRETLPPYSSDISLENVFTKKMELEGAVRRANDRNWNRVFATLQGTALSFYKYKSSGVFGQRTEFFDDFPDLPSDGKKGDFLCTYNLHHADVGIAADYTKKAHVIRIRAESDQFLLSCQRIETFIRWLQLLFTAIDLALPLDERELPQDLSVPRHQRRLAQHPSSMDAHQTLVRDGNDVISARNGSGVTTPSDGTNTASISTVTAEPVLPNTTSRVVLNITRTRPTGPSISPETGKWQPDHGWSARKDMIYAKNCMAILLSKSPRKSNFIIIKGRQWVVDWETGKLTRCDPPDYAEIENDRRVEGVSRSRKDPKS